MTIKERLKWLLKIAQAKTGSITISGDPSAVDVVALFPSITKAWGSENLNPIQQVVNIINQSLYILSIGQIDFNKLLMAQFNVDVSKYPDATIAAIIKSSILIYNNILTNTNQPFKNLLSSEDRRLKIYEIIQAINSSAIPIVTINNLLRTKIGGNLKEKIVAILATIK